MDELSEKLAGLLNDPETMSRVKQMAENLLGDNAAVEEKPPQNGFSDMLGGDELKMIMSIMGRMKNQGDDSRTRLLLSLKPHLSEPKREKVDTAVKILKIIEILPLLRDTGLLDF